MSYWILTIKPTLILIAAIAWWFRRHGFAPRSGLLGAQLIIAAVVEVYAHYLASLHRPNLWLYDLYVPVEFTLLLAYVHGQLSRSWQRRAVLPVWLLVAATYAADLRANFPDGFVSAAYITGSLVLVAAFLALLYDLALRVDVALFRQPLFYSHLGMALFFAGMVPLLGLWNQITDEDDRSAANLFIANHVFFAIRYGSIVVACAMPAIRDRTGPV